jgi:hypothetical protein
MTETTENQKRTLLRHLGDIFEAISCVSACTSTYTSIADAVEEEESLSGIEILHLVSPSMTPADFVERAGRAFMLWPNTLLAHEVNQGLLAYMVKHDLFDENEGGWQAYVTTRRVEVPWFGMHLPDDLYDKLMAGRETRLRR